MRRDFSFLADDAHEADTCVIGSGPAGMTIALELARAGQRVLMLEAGDETWTDESQAVYRGAVIGDAYLDLDTSRLRYLGGTSGHWTGMCRRLAAIDFEAKEDIAAARWPIVKADLDPFAARAAGILEIPDQPEDEVIDAANGIVKIRFPYSQVRFGDKYRDEIDASDRLAYVLNANVTRILTDGARVTGLEVEDYAGARATVRAGRYVLATGGIENSRILLWSDALANGALTHPASPVGRYWMEHPHHVVGSAIVSNAYLDSPAAERDGLGKAFYTQTAERQRAEGVLNASLRLEVMNYRGTKKLLSDLGCVAPAAAEWAADLVGRDLACGARVRVVCEQEPRPDNRVALSRDRTDAFGVPLTELHWKKSRRDHETIRAIAMAFGRHLIGNDHGRLRLDPWVFDGFDFPDGGEIGGNHHMGGTRMSDAPHDGVVDTDCRLWGQENLYVAGSSVFPAGGHANPTFTILQLALRLADHLKA